jgi:hypothetical protein
VQRVENALRGYSRQVATLRLLLRGVDPALGEAVVPGGATCRRPRRAVAWRWPSCRTC